MESNYPFSSSDFNNENTPHLPPGFCFCPTEEELITYYLQKKLLTFSVTAIAYEVDLNECEPWELPEKAKMGENEWYFFSLRDRKYPTGLRTNRATEAGYWKATGKDREIYSSKNDCGLVGMKKTRMFIHSCLAKATYVAEDFLIYGIPHFGYDCTDDESQAQGSKKEGMLLRNSSPPIIEEIKTSSSAIGCNESWEVALKGRDDNMNSRANFMQKVSSWITVLTLSANGCNKSWEVPLKGRDVNMNSRANFMQKVSSWITVLTFPGCLLLSNYKHYSSLCNDQIASLSIWLALLGMLNFTAFLPSLFFMAISGARFTRMQITMLLISAMLIIMKVYVPFLGFIFTHL